MIAVHDDAPSPKGWRQSIWLVYLIPMANPLRHLLMLWTTVIILTVGSALSAAMMAPDRGDATEAQVAMLGMTMEDICGDHAGHDHQCPYCHLLPDTPIPTPVEVASVLLPFIAWHQARDLHREAQARDHARSPRAPPVFI